jgi:hypothetical protein
MSGHQQPTLLASLADINLQLNSTLPLSSPSLKLSQANASYTLHYVTLRSSHSVCVFWQALPTSACQIYTHELTVFGCWTRCRQYKSWNGQEVVAMHVSRVLWVEGRTR